MMWLAVLDMDGTLLSRRTVDVLCEHLGLVTQLGEIDRQSNLLKPLEVSTRIAQLFAGVKASRMEEIFDGIDLVKGAEEFIGFLKSRDFMTAIITDSYVFLASRLARKLHINAVRGNVLEIVDGVITGRITFPLGWKKNKRTKCTETAVCKLHAMKELRDNFSIQDNRTLAVGDSQNDFYIIKEARLGVAFRPKDECLTEVADVVINTDFYDLMVWLKGFLDGLGFI